MTLPVHTRLEIVADVLDEHADILFDEFGAPSARPIWTQVEALRDLADEIKSGRSQYPDTYNGKACKIVGTLGFDTATVEVPNGDRVQVPRGSLRNSDGDPV